MHQRSYEVMFIVRPDVTEEDLDKLVTTLQGHATTAGAVVKSAEKMGKRRLAYEVRKFQEGQYILFILNADGKAVHESVHRQPGVSGTIRRIADSHQAAANWTSMEQHPVSHCHEYQDRDLSRYSTEGVSLTHE